MRIYSPSVFDSLFCSASATHGHAVMVGAARVDDAGAIPLNTHTHTLANGSPVAANPAEAKGGDHAATVRL